MQVDDVSATDNTFEKKNNYTVSFGFDANDKMPYCNCPD